MDQSKATGLCSAALFGAALFFANAAHAEYRCNAPKSHLDRKACEKAKEGPDALRRFIHRVRMMESLYYPDYVADRRRG